MLACLTDSDERERERDSKTGRFLYITDAHTASPSTYSAVMVPDRLRAIAALDCQNGTTTTKREQGDDGRGHSRRERERKGARRAGPPARAKGRGTRGARFPSHTEKKRRTPAPERNKTRLLGGVVFFHWSRSAVLRGQAQHPALGAAPRRMGRVVAFALSASERSARFASGGGRAR